MKNYDEAPCMKCKSPQRHWSGICQTCRSKKCSECGKSTTSKHPLCPQCFGKAAYRREQSAKLQKAEIA